MRPYRHLAVGDFTRALSLVGAGRAQRSKAESELRISCLVQRAQLLLRTERSAAAADLSAVRDAGSKVVGLARWKRACAQLDELARMQQEQARQARGGAGAGRSDEHPISTPSSASADAVASRASGAPGARPTKSDRRKHKQRQKQQQRHQERREREQEQEQRRAAEAVASPEQAAARLQRLQEREKKRHERRAHQSVLDDRERQRQGADAASARAAEDEGASANARLATREAEAMRDATEQQQRMQADVDRELAALDRVDKETALRARRAQAAAAASAAAAAAEADSDDSDDALFWDTVAAAESDDDDSDGAAIWDFAATGTAATSRDASASARRRLVVLDGVSIGQAHAAERQHEPAGAASATAASFSALGVKAAIEHFSQSKDADTGGVVAFVPEEWLDPLHHGDDGSARVLRELRDAQLLFAAPRGVDSFNGFLLRYMRAQLEEHGHECIVVSNASTGAPLQQQNFFFCGDEFYVV